MNYFESAFLGLVQGLTEFIPISSSGHLIIFRSVLGLEFSPSDLAFDAVLQLATAIAVLIFMRGELFGVFKYLVNKNQLTHDLEKYKILTKSLIVGTLPAVAAGIFLEDLMATSFRSVSIVAVTLLIGSVIMYVADRYTKAREELTIKRGFIVGLFQTLALVPGISRSGATIAGGLFSGLSREESTRFSFLLSFPILFGSGLKKLVEIIVNSSFGQIGPELIIGCVVAFVSGYLAMKFLVNFIKKNGLTLFVYYRIVLALVLVIFIQLAK
jgi:undecaprenyl-diphosphatase